MSAHGYPDWQKIQQWLGAPVVSATGLALGAGVHDDGPYNLASWASVIVAIKPTGGPVTVTVKQQVSGAPVSLELDTVFVIPAGNVVFDAVVLFGDAVTLHLAGSVGGTTVDYALYPSNTTTNAQVLASAVLDFQRGGVLVAAEPKLDFLDGATAYITVTDDPANSRVRVTPELVLPLNLVGRDFGPLAQIRLQNTVAGKTFSWYLGDDGVAHADFPTIISNVINVDSTGRVAINGYRTMRQPYGVDHRMESGVMVNVAAAYAIAFVTAYVTAPTVVGLAQTGAAITYDTVTTAGFTVRNPGASAVPFNWFAEGWG